MEEKIDKKNIEDIFRLTPTQMGMLIHYLENPHGDFHFEQLCLHITGNIDKNRFTQAWQEVARLNESLRTVFRWENVKEPVQVVLKNYSPSLRF